MLRHWPRAQLKASAVLAFSLGLSSCQGQAPEPPARKTERQTQPAVNSTQGSANSDTPAGSQGSSTPAGNAPVLPSNQAEALTEPQANSIIRGSCIFAGCHADIAVLMASANILAQVRDNLMPPPNQQRYTLRAEDRAALVKYFQAKMGTAAP